MIWRFRGGRQQVLPSLWKLMVSSDNALGHTRVRSPHTLAKKSKVAFSFHFLFSPRTNTSINCPNTFVSLNPSTSDICNPRRASIRGLFARFDRSIQTKSACWCVLSTRIECKYPRKCSSINMVLSASSRADKFISAAIACCDVFSVYKLLANYIRKYMSVSH
jgi:hypothetical protein